MLYLSGATNDVIQDDLVRADIGLMCQPRNSLHLRIGAFPFWAADNGCFAAKWEEENWLDWLARLPTERCLFAVAPDVYPDAQASLDRGMLYAELLRSMGFPVAIVAQDGAEGIDYPWDDFDCLFIGGARTDDPKDEWKTSLDAEGLVRTARSRGKWVHMGRVNSQYRLFRAREMGCNSVDGTYVKHGPNVNVPKLARYVRVVNSTPSLPFTRMETPSNPLYKEFI